MQDEAPETFPDVEVVTRANVYFDGKVVSHTVRFKDGSKKTLGLIYPGEYHFGTEAAERMQIVSGACRARLDGEATFASHPAGTSFRIPANSGFDVVVESGITEYVCSFE